MYKSVNAREMRSVSRADCSTTVAGDSVVAMPFVSAQTDTSVADSPQVVEAGAPVTGPLMLRISSALAFRGAIAIERRGVDMEQTNKGHRERRRR
jgi:hypothetical protein